MLRVRMRVLLIAALVFAVAPVLLRQRSWQNGSVAVLASGGETAQAPSAPENVTVQLTATQTGVGVCCFEYVAKVLSSGYAYSGMLVEFTVMSGPGEGSKHRAYTDSRGEARIKLCGDGNLADQTVRASSEGESDSQTVSYAACLMQRWQVQQQRNTGCSCDNLSSSQRRQHE